MTTAEKRLLRAVVRYSRYNASRSLGSAAESEFSATRFGAGSVLCDPARPRLPMFNRAVGLGAADAGRVGDILTHFKSHRCEPHFDLGADGLAPELIGELVERGFEPHDAIIYLAASPGTQPARPHPEVTVERLDNGRADEFRELLGTSGVTCADAVWEQRRALYATDEFRVFVARVDGAPAAWATSFVVPEEKVAYLANAYTQPASRGRGCHRALLDARLADTRALGLKTALTDVVPDTTSQRNCRRAGFKPAFTLTLWRR